MANAVSKAARADTKAAASAVLASPGASHFHDVMRGLLTISLYEPEAVAGLISDLLAMKAVPATAGWGTATAPAAPAPSPKNAWGAFAPQVSREGTEASRIQIAAKAFLRDRGSRATSGAIAEALAKQNVEIGGFDKASRVSAYLSASKDFDNVRGEGYGLREWANAGGAMTFGAVQNGDLV